MKRPTFTDSGPCGSGAHCGACRDLDGGRPWRESLRVAFKLPGDETDFECPRGLSWGFKGKASAIETLHGKVSAICNECEHKTEHHCRDCRVRRMLKLESLRKFGAMCPQGKWTVYAAEPDKLVVAKPVLTDTE